MGFGVGFHSDVSNFMYELSEQKGECVGFSVAILAQVCNISAQVTTAVRGRVVAVASLVGLLDGLWKPQRLGADAGTGGMVVCQRSRQG